MGTMTLDQGADDDDLHISLLNTKKVVDEMKPEEKKRKPKVVFFK